jgi:hypothetical protein
MTKSMSILIGLGAIWLSSTAIALLAPDLVSGSEQEHLPLAAITVWIWDLVASGYIVLLAQIKWERSLNSEAWKVAGVAVAGIWMLAAVVAILGPTLVTGSDPTEVPLAALIAPPIATLGTALACFLVAALGHPTDTTPDNAAQHV